MPPGLVLAVAVASVSFAAVLFRLAEAAALTASFWRLAFAVLLLLPFARHSWRLWRGYDVRTWQLTTAAGVALGAHFALWVSSLFLTTVAASVALVTLQAVFVAIGGHLLLGDKLTSRGWLGVLAAFAGAVTIAAADGSLAPDSRRALLGDALALAGGLGSAAYMLIGRVARRDLDTVTYVVPVYGIAALTVLAVLPIVGQPVTAGVGGAGFVFFVLLAAVPMLGGHTLANWCLKYLPAHTIATWILLEPVGAALLAWPILGEVPHPVTAVGAAMVIAGAWQTMGRAGTVEAAPEVPALHGTDDAREG